MRCVPSATMVGSLMAIGFVPKMIYCSPFSTCAMAMVTMKGWNPHFVMRMAFTQPTTAEASRQKMMARGHGMPAARSEATIMVVKQPTALADIST